jgi:uncharacterized repeat protein (TIGR01451 family)
MRRQEEDQAGEGEEVDMFRKYAFPRFVLCAIALVALCAPVSASAETPSPQWTVTAFSTPTNLAPGGTGLYRVYVQNTGGAPSDGEKITVTDALPAGLKATGELKGIYYETNIEKTARDLSCTGLACTYSGVVGTDTILQLELPVEVEAGPFSDSCQVPEGAVGCLTNLVSASGGGALVASVSTPTVISFIPAKFGIAPGSLATALSSTQAGGHPDLTTVLAFNTVESGRLAGNPRESGGTLPPGFIGDLADTPKCPIVGFSEEVDGALHCSPSAIVGTVTFYIGSFPYQSEPQVESLMNLTTNPGEIAKLGFTFLRFGIQGTVSLTPGKYGVRLNFTKIQDTAGALHGISLTVWGVPAEHTHDLMRGLDCHEEGCYAYSTETEGGLGTKNKLEDFPEGQPVTTPTVPYLTSPTDCTSEPLQATITTNSWEEPGHEVEATSSVGPMTGCGPLEFAPAITASPDTTRADTPAGFTFGVKMGQEGLVNPSTDSESDIQDTSVTLPEGVAVNPGQANGLGACQLSQARLEEEGPPSCPSNSKVGHVAVETPVLRNKLEGEVYVLQSNPPNLKLLVAPEDPADGIYVKFVGNVHLNETTGQLTTTFEKTPQLAFSDLKLSFSGGAQAALSTPTGCGTYTVNTVFTPWSTPFVADTFPSSSFAIEAGPGGSVCPSSPLPFSPSLDAGATTDQAGGFTNFSLLLTREDGQQRISTLQFKTPEGLLGMISRVPLCGEPQAAKGECSAASQIGHTVVEAGPGPYPLVVPQPGSPPAPIYLTGGYKGAPYGLSIVVPLVVGPFNLGTIVTRSKIEVDPHTSQLTVTTDPLPSIVDGVPSDLRTINAVIDRPEFMFNPTSCAPTSFSGTATSTEGTSAPISTHFQVGSCRSLKFQPNFKVFVSGKTSKENGASLDAKVVYPTGPLGDNQASSQSNIAYVKVSLPKQLPSRLTTLQKACTAAQFESNPSGCPAASVVGIAKAVTPVLPVPLTGPVYFVSHGGEAFPSLIVVLQGYGVTVDLVGTTFISKSGITSSTFKTVPDVPIDSFELYLPQGAFSALTANGNLCKSKLVMPTEFVAQNGAVIHQNTPIGVTKCPKAKKVRKAIRARKAGRTRGASHPNHDRRHNQ